MHETRFIVVNTAHNLTIRTYFELCVEMDFEEKKAHSF